MIIIIKLTVWFYSKMGYAITIYKSSNINYYPYKKLEINTNIKVGACDYK